MEEKERIEIVGKTILLIILIGVISICFLFFYGVSKVNAAGNIHGGSVQIWDGSTQKSNVNCNENPCQNQYIGLTHDPKFNYDFNSVSWGTARFNWNFEIELTYAAVGFFEQVINNIVVGSMANGTFTDYTGQCQIAGTSGYRGSIHINDTDYPTYNYNIIVNCNNIAPPGNQQYQRIRISLSNNNYIYVKARIYEGNRTYTEYASDPTIQSIDRNTNVISGSISSAAANIISEMQKQWNQYIENWENITYSNKNYSNINPNNADMNTTEAAENQLYNNYGVPAGAIGDISVDVEIPQNASAMLWFVVNDFVHDTQEIWILFIGIFFLMIIATLLNR